MRRKFRKAHFQTSLSLPPKGVEWEEVERLLEQCDEIMLRDKWNFNFLVYKALKEFVPRHKANPQIPMKNFLAELSLICVYCGKGGFKKLSRVETLGGELKVCSGCLKDLKRRGLVKKVLGVV